MDIDGAGHDDLAGRIVGRIGARALRRVYNFAVAHPDIADVVATIGWIDDASAGNARQHGRGPLLGKADAMRVIASATEIASLGCVASTAASAPVNGQMLHCGVIDAGTADADVNAWWRAKGLHR